MSPKRREDGQTVANENVNRNNNRLSLPAGTTEPQSPGIQSAPLHSRKFFPPGGSSATSSSRSSIASASSVGTNHTLSSLSSHGGSSSPRSSSPVAWGLGGIPPQHQGPGRTSSSSSADTVKSAGRPHERPPVIKTSRNTRSGSFGGGAMCSDRRINPISTSNPSLNAPINNPLILPNHPQIPRTPSIDSGIVSAGSISADSTRFNPDETDLFRHSRPHHRDHHRVNDAAPHPRRQPQQYGETPPNPRRQPPTDVENDKVEQTFLSGFRGLRDSPRPDKKDPSNYFTQGGYPSEPTLYPGHVPPGVNRPMYVVPRGFGKGVVKGIHDYLICERHAMMRYRMQHKPDPKTPEALLEDQLVLELQNQRPQNSRPRRRNSPPVCEDSNLANTKRLSLSKSDPALNNYPESCYEGVIPTRTSSPKSFIKQASLGHPSPLSPAGDTVFTPHSIYHTPNTSKNSFSTPLKALDTPSYPQFTPTSTPNSSRTSIPARAEDPSLNWQYPAQEFPPQRPTTLNMPPWASPITPTSHFDPHHEMNGVIMTPNIPPQLLHGSPGPHPRRKTSQDWSETDLDGEIPQQTITAWGSSASLPSTPMISKSGNPPKHQPDHLHPTLHGSQITPHGSHITPRTSKEKKPAPTPPQRSTSFARSQQLRLSTHGSPDSPPPSPTSNLSFDASVAKLGSRLDNGWLNNGHVIGNGRIGFNQTTEQRTGLDRRSLPTYTEAVNQIHLKQSRFTTTNYRSFNIETRENSEQVSQV